MHAHLLEHAHAVLPSVACTRGRAVAALVAGRSDDNPDFRCHVRDIDEQHEEMLTQWEHDLRRREMRDRANDDGD